MSKKYCGIYKIPKGKKRGNMVDCVNLNQIRYYGYKIVDPKTILYSKYKLKLDKEKKRLRSNIIKLRARKNKYIKLLKSMANVTNEKDLIKKEEIRTLAKNAQAGFLQAIEDQKKFNNKLKKIPKKSQLIKETPSKKRTIINKMVRSIKTGKDLNNKNIRSQKKLTSEIKKIVTIISKPALVYKTRRAPLVSYVTSTRNIPKISSFSYYHQYKDQYENDMERLNKLQDEARDLNLDDSLDLDDEYYYISRSIYDYEDGNTMDSFKIWFENNKGKSKDFKNYELALKSIIATN